MLERQILTDYSEPKSECVGEEGESEGEGGNVAEPVFEVGLKTARD